MPKPLTRERRRTIHVSLPETVLAAIEERFFDAARQRPLYGIHATLIGGLLKKWLADPSILPVDIIEEKL